MVRVVRIGPESIADQPAGLSGVSVMCAVNLGVLWRYVDSVGSYDHRSEERVFVGRRIARTQLPALYFSQSGVIV